MQKKTYEDCKNFWNNIFEKDEILVPLKKESGNQGFDDALKWLCQESDVILDFGCGSGTVLFFAALYGTKIHIGIDLSEEGIKKATQKSNQMCKGTYEFVNAGIDSLKNIKSEYIDGIVLSNILDNLYPEDAYEVLKECKRILKQNGKVFVKVNPYLTDSDIEQYEIKVINSNVLDDGLILWNNTKEQWEEFFYPDFITEEYREIFYPEHEQTNRVFLLRKK